MAPRRDHISAPRHGTDRLLALLFFAAITAPLVATLLAVAAGRRVTDEGHRSSAPWPGAITSWHDAERWPARFRRWFKDHHAGRAGLITAHGRLLLNVLGASPSPTVLLGRDGWWFYTDDDAMGDIVSARPMPEASVERWTATLEANRAWLAGRGIPYVFVLAPDKHVIYPEYLPATVRGLTPSRIGQIAEALRARTRVQVIDLRGPLLERKAVERVFHRTDTHWNNRGAVTAYLEIARWMAVARLGPPSPGRIPANWNAPRALPTRDDFVFEEQVGPGQDLPRMLGLEELVAEHVLEAWPRAAPRARVVEPPGAPPTLETGRLVTEHPDASLPRVVVFRDSFMSSLVPLLAERCSRCVFLWQKDLDPEVIRQERPDLVIHQMVGRRLQSYLPYDAVSEELKTEN